jgi:hypothetical protein
MGGGEGYGDIIQPAQALAVVATRTQLLGALSSAAAGDIVYVDDNAVIDLTGETHIPLPPAVTLASGRGHNGSQGALLFASDHDTKPLFKVLGDNVRVTGLRLRGPDPDMHESAYVLPIARGISAFGYHDLEVDNCELWAWSHAAIYLRDGEGAHIHHNYMHHNRRSGLGYGVVLGGDAEALIEANVFKYNRHAIAGDGDRDQAYEARYNLVLGGANGHSFDMHGEDENLHNGHPYAGDWIYIHHNTFLAGSVYGVVVRGRPKTGAWITHNAFVHADQASAVKQRLNFGNFWVWENCYSYEGFFVSWSGTESWRPLKQSRLELGQLGFGDFDNDGKTDAFMANGSRWYMAGGGDGPWSPLARSGYTLPQLAFGDFDGDGRTDVFRASGSQWFVSYGGTSRWSPLAKSGYTLPQLAFGDFDGDGRTDVFRASGSQWFVSYAATSRWSPLAPSSFTLSSLAFGDFNGDGNTDVFRTGW